MNHPLGGSANSIIKESGFGGGGVIKILQKLNCIFSYIVHFSKVKNNLHKSQKLSSSDSATVNTNTDSFFYVMIFHIISRHNRINMIEISRRVNFLNARVSRATWRRLVAVTRSSGLHHSVFAL